MSRKKIKYLFIATIALVLLVVSVPNLVYKNRGESTSYGNTGNGRIENPYQVKFRDENYRYFSLVSYFIMDNGFVHSSLEQTIQETYKECKTTCPGKYFRIMECSGRRGGKLRLHRTHRNGLSVDFMVPKVKNNKQFKIYDRLGLWHYLLNFDSSGRIGKNKKVQIDFETMGKHIIALDNAARMNGLRINKVILKIDLKDDLFSTDAGKEIRKRGIYFAQNLPGIVNKLHDDHYHIDFRLLNQDNTNNPK
jgi:penicillin-insensitive murein DD-endopeptidase